MRNCILLILATSFWPLMLTGQNEANQFWLGYHGNDSLTYSLMTIDVSGPLPVISTHPKPNAEIHGTNASICSYDGSILMATNGMQLFSKDSLIIDTIAFGNYWQTWEDYGFPMFNAALILPVPDHADEYSIIYHNALIAPNEGELLTTILEARVKILDDNSFFSEYKDHVIAPFHKWYHRGLSAVKHANGRDWWIIFFEHNSNKYYRYLLAPSGIVDMGTDTVSDVIRSGVSIQNFSSSGNYFYRLDEINFDEGQFITLFSFDRCSGKLELKHRLQSSTGYFTGAAMSPSEQYLYADTNDTLWQWDLHAGDIKASKILIDINKGYAWPGWLGENFGMPFLALDKRIYIISANGGSHSISVIERPDEPGTACRFVQNEIILPRYTSRTTPNLGNFRLGPMDGSDCDTLGLNNIPVADWRWEIQDSVDPLKIRFTDLSYFRPETWMWDFDDGTTSSLHDPIHTYEVQGLYHVCLTVSNEFASDSTCRWVKVEGTSAISSPKPCTFQINPNPFSDYIEITSSQVGYHLYKIKLTDVNGSNLISLEIPVPGKIMLNSIPAGVYFISLYDQNTLIYTSKFMKVSE